MHSADIILIWNSFLSAVAGATPAWLHPKSITLLGPLASVWRGIEWHSVQALSQTFNLKDNVVFHFEGHLWYRSDVVFYGWGDCHITSKHSLIQITRCESWLEGAILSCQSGWNGDNKWMQSLIFLKPQVAVCPYRLHRRNVQTEKLPPFHYKTTTSVWQLTSSYGISPLYLQRNNTCVKQTSPKMFGYSFAATSRYVSIMESAQCTGV